MKEQDLTIASMDGNINFTNPHENTYTLNNIARGLCYKGHYCGQTSMYFSIAAHCLLAEDLYTAFEVNSNKGAMLITEGYITKEEVTAIFTPVITNDIFLMNRDHVTLLLHDVDEAYLPDIPGPIKKRLPAYKLYSDILTTDIFIRLGLSVNRLKALKVFDIIAQRIEKEILIPEFKKENGVTKVYHHIINNYAQYDVNSHNAFAQYLYTKLLRANVEHSKIYGKF